MGASETDYPRPGLTGIENAGGLKLGNESRELVLDWLSGTFLGLQGLDASGVRSKLEYCRETFGEMVPRDRGFRGYGKSAVVLGSGRIAWDFDRSDMGVHVDLPSGALAELERTLDVWEIRYFIANLLDEGFRVSRVDFALDDSEGLVKIGECLRLLDAREFSSKWAIWRYERRSDGQQKLTFGNRGSKAYGRLYDKAAEKGVEEHWVRFEMEFKGDRAVAVVERWLQDGDASFVCGMMADYLDFKESGSGQLTRRGTVAWWREFVGSDKVVITLAEPDRDLDDVWDWLSRQVAPSLGMVANTDGGWRKIEELVDDGLQRLTDVQLAMLPLDVRVAVSRKRNELVGGNGNGRSA